jgi:hypothetical protein
LQPFVAWVVRRRFVVVAAFTVITLLLLSQIRSLQVIVDPDETFPQSHPFVIATNTVEQLFGNKYAVVIGITAREGDVFQPKILAKVAEITKALSLNEGWFARTCSVLPHGAPAASKARRTAWRCCR